MGQKQQLDHCITLNGVYPGYSEVPPTPNFLSQNSSHNLLTGKEVMKTYWTSAHNSHSVASDSVWLYNHPQGKADDMARMWGTAHTVPLLLGSGWVHSWELGPKTCTATCQQQSVDIAWILLSFRFHIFWNNNNKLMSPHMSMHMKGQVRLLLPNSHGDLEDQGECPWCMGLGPEEQLISDFFGFWNFSIKKMRCLEHDTWVYMRNSFRLSAHLTHTAWRQLKTKF